MKTNKWILGGLMAMAITACTSDELVENNSQQPAKGEVVSVTAYTPGDGNSSRVALNDKPDDKPDDGLDDRLVSLTWEANDRFTVIQGNEYTNFTNGDGGGNTFTGVLPDDTSTDDDNFYAVYPALSVSEASGSSASVTVPFDLSEQKGVLDASMTYMYASSKSGLSYQFKHLTAILKVNSFTGLPEGAIVKKLEVITPVFVDGNLTFQQISAPVEPTTSGETAGEGTAAGDNKIVKANVVNGTTNTITIDYVALDQSFDTPVYIYLPPMDKANKTLAFNMTVIVEENGQQVEKDFCGILEGDSNKNIEAGKLYNVAEVQLQLDNSPYVTLTNTSSTDSRRFYLTNYDSMNASLQYSLNGASWQTWTANTSVEIPAGKSMRLRGMNPNGTGEKAGGVYFDDDDEPRFLSISSGYYRSHCVTCSGDIRTLVNWIDYENVATDENNNVRFCKLFSGCTELIDISNLDLLPEGAHMAESCYEGMFKNCSGLTSIPADFLPETKLANSCYKGMFVWCIGLGTDSNPNVDAIPANLLPATTLAESCYSYMFSECDGLQSVPEGLLPAGKNGVGKLDIGCYSMMFYGCSGLTSIPEKLLPATTLAESCYSSMFFKCSELVDVPQNLLPAQILTNSCYARMFEECTNLEKAPVLSAQTLATNCYQYMFYECTSLNNVTMLLAENVNGNYYNYFNGWLYKVSSQGTFTKDARMTGMPILPTDYRDGSIFDYSMYGIPEGWEVKVVNQGVNPLPGIGDGGGF